MQNASIVNTILDYIPTINWGYAADNGGVSLFETTIRYLAGMLSGELLGHIERNFPKTP